MTAIGYVLDENTAYPLAILLSEEEWSKTIQLTLGNGPSKEPMLEKES